MTVGRWETLHQVARKIFQTATLPSELRAELVMALAGIECLEHVTTGMIGNLVDDSHINPMWHVPLSDENKDAIVQPDRVPDWIEDYRYQDQTDRPENVTAAQYEARKCKWHELCLEDWNATRLQHSVANFNGSNYQDLYRLECHLGLWPDEKEE